MLKHAADERRWQQQRETEKNKEKFNQPNIEACTLGTIYRLTSF